MLVYMMAIRGTSNATKTLTNNTINDKMHNMKRVFERLNSTTLIVFTLIGALVVSAVAWPVVPQAEAVNSTAAMRCLGTTVVGHRGASGSNFKENTIPAFRHAIASGAKVIEFDIHRTKKSKGSPAVWVVYHDKKIKGRTISKTSYKTLKRIEPTLTTYPSAMAYLSRFKDIRVFAEIKPSHITKYRAKYIGSIVNRYGMRNRTEIHSFHKSVLTKFRKYNKGFRIGYIMNTPKYSGTSIRKFANTVVLNQNLIYGNRVSVSSMKRAGLTVYAYTANNEAQFARLNNYGVNGIITDNSRGYVTWCNGIQEPITPPPTTPPPTEPTTPPTEPTTPPTEPTEPTEPPVEPDNPAV